MRINLARYRCFAGFLLGCLVFCFFSAIVHGQESEPKTEQLVSMDFQDVELRQVVRFVSEMTGKNMVVDEKLKGKVTISTPSPISVDEAFAVFQSVLSVYHYSVIESGNIYKIVPENQAKTEGASVAEVEGGPKGEDEVVCRLSYLEHANANVLVPLLKPLIHNWGIIVASIPNNAIIVTDSAATVRKLSSIIKSLDVPRAIGAWKLFPLMYGNAAQVEKIVNSVYADFNAQQPKGLPSIRIFSDVRTNTLLVVAPRERHNGIGDIIAKLDTRAKIGQGNLHIYYPKNAKADVIAKVLTELIGKVKGAGAGEQSTSFSKNISVVGEATSNSLVISATPHDYELLLPIIEGLDVRQLQVYVEALVLEMSAERGVDFGIEWRSPESLSNESITAFGGTNFGTINSSTFSAINDPANNPLASASGLALGFVKGTVTYGGTEFLNLGALVRALQNDSDINVLSTPNILVVDNEQAEILVGQNVPFRTGSNTGTNTITTIERKDVGLKLQVTPQILEGSKVRLTVYQEQSSLAPSIIIGADETDVVTNKRSIQTTVMLNNGHMVVLGGLISEDTTQQVNMVPCLGGLYGVGELFKNTSRSSTKRNMMVFLRPVIINTYDDLLAISEKKYETLRDGWQERSGHGSDILPDMSASPLPSQLPISPAR